jgi:hypothetical protein
MCPGCTNGVFHVAVKSYARKITPLLQADLANQTKSYARKISTFACSPDSDEAMQTLRLDLENLCEKIAYQIYSVNEPYRPMYCNIVKSYLRESRKVF